MEDWPLLRDEYQVLLNDIVVKCEEIAYHLDTATQLVDDRSLSRIFEDLAGQHREMIGTLERYIRGTGELPRAADADKELFEGLITRIKTAASEDAHQTLIEERISAENELLQIIAEGSERSSLPRDTRIVLHALEERVLEILNQLNEAVSV